MKKTAFLAFWGLLLVPFFAVGEELVRMTWHDGQKEHEVWLKKGYFIDFNGNSSAGADDSSASKDSKNSAGNKALSGSSQKPEFVRATGNARIFKSSHNPATLSTKSAASTASTEELPEGASPLFQRTQTSTSSAMGLPGDIFIQLDESLTQAEINRFMAENNLKLKKIYIRNHFLIETPSGIASLETANRLRVLKGVIAAYPNWWQELSLR